MDIDPRKIDFSKMRPYQDLEKDNRENIGEKASDDFSNHKDNSDGGEEKRQKHSETKENNVFSGEKLMSVFGLLSLSWKMFKERWKKLVGLALLSVAISMVMSAINFILKLVVGSSLLFTVLEFIITLIFYIPDMLIAIAVIEVMRNKNLGIFEAVNNATKKLVSFFFTGLIGILAMIAVLVVNMIVVLAGFLILGFILSFTVSLSGSDGVLGAFINVIIWLLGFIAILLMLLPTLIASLWLYFAMLAIVLENMSPMESLSYSYELMKKKMLSVAWKNAMVFLLLMLMFAAVLVPLIIVPFLIVIVAPVILIASIFVISPITYLFQYNIYENLKVIKKDKLPTDFAARHQGKIKIFAALGALIVILFILFSMLSGSLFYDLKSKFIKLYNHDLQDKRSKENYSNEESKNSNMFSEAEKRDKQRLLDLDSISLMLWHYKEKNGSYPISDSVAKLNEDNSVVSEIRSANVGEKIPTDPSGKYYYGYESDGETYELSAVFENKKDTRCELEGSLCIYRLKHFKETENKSNNAANQELVHESVKKDGISYEIYLPANYSESQSHSLFICLSPSGDGTQFYRTVYPAASEFNWIMACSNDFKNNIPLDDYLPKITKTVNDVKSRFKIGKVYIGGFSGGGMGSYVVSYFNPVFSGLIINSGAIHQNLYNKNEIKKIKAKKVVLICGRKDSIVSCSYMKQDEAFLKAAGFETLLIEFDGGHEIAPQEIYKTAIEWLE